MGGNEGGHNTYNSDVDDYQGPGSSSSTGFSAQPETRARQQEIREPDPEYLPVKNGIVREVDSRHETTVFVFGDATKSMGIMYAYAIERIGNFFIELFDKGYAKDPAIAFFAYGDAKARDRWPFQITPFTQSREILTFLNALKIEFGGGGSGEESAEMAALWGLRHIILTNPKFPVCFFITDEGYYPTVDPALFKQHFAEDIGSPMNSLDVFKGLARKFNGNLFVIYIKQPAGKRKEGIDAEIAERLRLAGGQSGAIRVSLLWDNRNDLDLHCICPCGNHIYFNDKRCNKCGGHLDVDRNVQGETTKPVENIYFPHGKARIGKYRIYVQNYRYNPWRHEDQQPSGSNQITEFTVELEINGEIQHFAKNIQGERESSDVLICEFDYLGETQQATGSIYDNYDDAKIIAQWEKAVGKGHVLVLSDHNLLIELMMGIVAKVCGTTMDKFLADAITRKISAKRVEKLAGILDSCSGPIKPAAVKGKLPPQKLIAKPK